jgi:hypothetical protein
MGEKETATNVPLRESYQPDTAKKSYQPKLDTTQTPQPPKVGSSVVTPLTPKAAPAKSDLQDKN